MFLIFEVDREVGNSVAVLCLVGLKLVGRLADLGPSYGYIPVYQGYTDLEYVLARQFLEVCFYASPWPMSVRPSTLVGVCGEEGCGLLADS